MKIIKDLHKNINLEDLEFRYSYRMTLNNFKLGHAYGIEIERQDYKGGQLIKVERDYIDKVSCYEYKVADLLNKLFNNTVSPIHLIDVLGEYADEYVYDFSEKEAMVVSL